MEGLTDSRTVICSKNIQLLQTRGSGFVEEEFLYKKISKKDVYVNYGATAVIPQVAVKQYGDWTAH